MKVTFAPIVYRGCIGIIEDITKRTDLENSIINIEDRERKRIGHDLHDGLGQLLTGLAFRVRKLGLTMEKNASDGFDEVGVISTIIDEAKKQSRLLARGLSPLESNSGGLLVALKTLVSDISERFDVSCVFNNDMQDFPFDETVVLQLYRIAQEAITNAIKHAMANNIVVSLIENSEKVLLSIKDDGTGMEKIVDTNGSMGMQIMKYRAGMINGQLEITSSKEGGTEVVCILSDIRK